MIFESVHNYFEKLVYSEIYQRLPTLNAILELSHLEDAACIALNSLPPRYIRHDVDAIFYLTAHEQNELAAKVTEAVTKALDFVISNPDIGKQNSEASRQ